jgi:inner membrane protein
VIIAVFAAAGALPDIDFLLPLEHRGPSHSLFAACLTLGLAWALVRNLRLSIAVAAAYASHSLLDWLGEDSWSPMGVMILWPLSHEYYVSGIDLFAAVNRRYWTPGFWRGNAVAVLREIVILGPVVWLIRRGARRG